jgi:hypothetical protein
MQSILCWLLKYPRAGGDGFSGTLLDNPFEPDQMILGSGHYHRMRDFEKMGKRILSDVGTHAQDQLLALECEGKQKGQKSNIQAFIVINRCVFG